MTVDSTWCGKVVLLALLGAPLAWAMCSGLPQGRQEIIVRACRALTEDEAWLVDVRTGKTKPDGAPLRAGALVTDLRGDEYAYATAEADPCRQFPVGAVVVKVVESICCDTGMSGPCLFGGRWLKDLDSSDTSTGLAVPKSGDPPQESTE